MDGTPAVIHTQKPFISFALHSNYSSSRVLDSPSPQNCFKVFLNRFCCQLLCFLIHCMQLYCFLSRNIVTYVLNILLYRMQSYVYDHNIKSLQIIAFSQNLIIMFSTVEKMRILIFSNWR